MPEGPEIRRAAEGLHAALARRKAQRVFFAFEHLRPFQKELAGRRVRRVESRGKAILLSFSGGWTVYSHNQLYGRWYVEPAGSVPATGRSLRFAVHTRERSALLYSASEIEVLRDSELAAHSYLGRLGPDVLAPTTTAEQVAGLLAEERFRRRSFASLLLDQCFLAGVGNYLRSEILFFAGLDPRRRPRDCSSRRLGRLAVAAIAVSRRAYETGGITNLPGRVAALKKSGLDRAALRHAVFGREGLPCWACGSKVVRVQLAGRRAYLCPTCQPR